MDALYFLACDFVGLEQCLWASEYLVPKHDLVAVWQLMGHRLVGSLSKLLHGPFKVDGDVALLLFRVASVLPCCLLDVAELHTVLQHELHEVLCQVLPCQVHLIDCVAQREALVDWHRRSHRITRVYDYACRAPRSKQREHLQ